MSQTPTTYGLPKKRELVVEELKLAYANQNLEDQEYERRLNEAMNAKSNEELMLVIFDFPAEIRNRVFPKDVSLPNTHSQPSSQIPANFPTSDEPDIQVIMGSESRILPELTNTLPNISAILSSQRLDFRISKVPETPIHMRVECILSATVIDLRNENLDGKHINIRINGMLGEIKILLPRGVKIQRNIQIVAGECKIQNKQRSWINRLMGNKEPQSEIQLTVNLTGNFWLGTIKLIY